MCLLDIGARCAELGRQPYTARNFFLRYSKSILFATDLASESEMYPLHFRFLDEVLRSVYRDNANRLLRRSI